MELQPWFRECKRLVVTFILAQPLSASSWRQNSLMSMSEKMMKAVVNGCAWGLRDSQGSLLNRSWQVLTTSPDIQRVLNHRVCDKKHKHGRLFDLSSGSSLQFPKSLCQTLAKQFLVKDSWHSVLGILEHLHPDEGERPFNPSASSHETPMEVDREGDVPPPALHHLHCHHQRHLLMRVQTHLSERRSPIGYKRFINRLVIVTIAPW